MTFHAFHEVTHTADTCQSMRYTIMDRSKANTKMNWYESTTKKLIVTFTCQVVSTWTGYRNPRAGLKNINRSFLCIAKHMPFNIHFHIRSFSREGRGGSSPRRSRNASQFSATSYRSASSTPRRGPGRIEILSQVVEISKLKSLRWLKTPVLWARN